MKQGSSGLTLREPQLTQITAFELTPKKVNLWVNNLPIANLGDSSKSTYRLLVDINQAEIEPDKRLAMLSTIEPVALELVIALEKQFINNHIALTEKQKKIAALIQAIQTEISIGYHTIVESIVNTQIKRSHKKILSTALTMAMKYHGLVMLRCYQLYTSIPRRIWREVYCLYQLAREYEVENQSLNNDETHKMDTCHNYFMRILLLSIANPYQLRQQDIQLLWELLPELSEQATLMTHAFNKQHFVVSLGSSSPPVHKSLQPPHEQGNHLKLTAVELVEQLKQMLVSLKKSSQLSMRKTMLLRHLIQCWSHGAHRSFARSSCTEHLEISIGLGATHYQLSQLPNGSEGLSDDNDSTIEVMEGSLKNATLLDVSEEISTGTSNSTDYLSSTEVDNQDVWAKLYRPGQVMKEALSEIESKNRSRDSIVKESYRLQEVDLINMSPGGYCIQMSCDALPKHSQTGEILGFLENTHGKTKHWSIGVVRWVRRQAKGSIVNMGIQLLAPGAIPINIQLRNSKSDSNDFQRALLLPALTGVGQPATLITNPLSFALNSKVRIIEHGLEYDARLSKEVSSSSSFKQFHFEKLDRGKLLPQGPDKKPTSEPPELEGIWDLI